jgi:proline racemase
VQDPQGSEFRKRNRSIIKNYFSSNAPKRLHIDNITYDGDDHLITFAELELPGATLLEQVRYLQNHRDSIRTALLGDVPTRCVDLIVPPKDSRAVAGYIIMETMGYPPFSGSNSLATAYSLVQNGFVEKQEGRHSFLLECPAGLVEVTYQCDQGEVSLVSLSGQDVYLAHDGLELEICGQKLEVPIVYSGGFYLMIPAHVSDLELQPANYPDFIAIGKQAVEAARHLYSPQHLQIGDVGPIAFANFMRDRTPAGHYVGATFVYPDVICYCPTGTGASAHTLIRYLAGEVQVGDRVEVQSPIGSTMLIDILGANRLQDRPRLQLRINGLPTAKEKTIQALV